MLLKTQFSYAMPNMASNVNTSPLSYIVFKGKRLRLAWLEAPNTLYLDGIYKDSHLQVLFVAADILSLSTVPSKNHCRIHARYAKDGLATKIFSSGAPLLKCSSGLWFYSIKGLFKVAFEYLSEDFQEFCLVHLKDWWISALADSAIEKEITICHLKTFREMCPNISSTPEDNASQQSDTYSNMNQSGQLDLCEKTISTDQEDGIQPLTEAGSLYVSNDTEICSVTIQTTPQSGNKNGQSVDVLQSLVDEIIHRVKCLLNTYDKQNRSREYHQCDSLMTLLTFYRREIMHSLEPNIFPIELMKSYCTLSEQVNLSQMYANDFGISIRRNAMLCLISEWLGDQFRDISDQVEEKVVSFKKQHISSIYNLPPASDIISDVFPRCMSVLLFHWMASRNTISQLAGRDITNASHSSEPELLNKKPRTNFDLEFVSHLAPLVQIILEFANRALISGVAHVVFAQVTQSVKPVS